MARAREDRPKAWLSWSSGKDSAYALAEVRRAGTYDVVRLLTTVTDAFGRVSMHGVREELLDAQAAAVGLPLEKVRIPYPCPNATYEREMARALDRAAAEGVRHMVFGDLFLEEVRAYREERLRPLGVEAVFPLWGRPTGPLAEEMVRAGLRARVCCLDPRHLPRELAGRAFDLEFLASLPSGVDPCGERGEFHTFVSEGPGFRAPVRVHVGETVEREGFVFTDLLPEQRKWGPSRSAGFGPRLGLARGGRAAGSSVAVGHGGSSPRPAGRDHLPERPRRIRGSWPERVPASETQLSPASADRTTSLRSPSR